MFETIQLIIKVGGILMLAFLVLLSMPQSRLREIVVPILGWSISAISVGYLLWPMDLLPEAFLGPFGLADDAVALAVAIGSGIAAKTAKG